MNATKIFICSACGKSHDCSEYATECCAPQPITMYRCEDCCRNYYTEKAAEECCKGDDDGL